MADDRRWDAGQSGGDPAGFRPSGRMIGTGIVVLALVIFVLQNTNTTSITLFIFRVSFPLWLVLAGTIVLSVGVGYALGSRGRSKRKK
jgi:uncharacterized integral membrane protein